MKTDLREVYCGKRVLVTGHTGFKGSWLCEWLLALGAEVHGLALPPPTKPSLFRQLKLSGRIKSHTLGDVRNLETVGKAVKRVMPEFVFHLAAQPLVRLSYEKPVETFDTNIMGTVNVLEAIRKAFRGTRMAARCSAVCVTTDKCYENRESPRPYREDDPMGGFDPYSCSKGCDELVISSYRRAFFSTEESPAWVASARAGNVIGGGDWAKDRIVPDAMRAVAAGVPVPVRNMHSTRPWQHVLEPICGYLSLGAALASRTRFSEFCGGFNFGPDPKANRSVLELVEEMSRHCGATWQDKSDPAAVHEAGILNLDIRKARRVLGWSPRWNFETTVEKTVSWYEQARRGVRPDELTRRQIHEYEM
jgi:CDP-glucose 4,6-dehydratase